MDTNHLMSPNRNSETKESPNSAKKGAKKKTQTKIGVGGFSLKVRSRAKPNHNHNNNNDHQDNDDLNQMANNLTSNNLIVRRKKKTSVEDTFPQYMQVSN
jgi:hypothetical protein